jgi:hypothetical protein
MSISVRALATERQFSFINLYMILLYGSCHGTAVSNDISSANLSSFLILITILFLFIFSPCPYSSPCTLRCQLRANSTAQNLLEQLTVAHLVKVLSLYVTRRRITVFIQVRLWASDEAGEHSPHSHVLLVKDPFVGAVELPRSAY